MRLVFSLAIAAVIAGCASDPPYARPSIALPPVYLSHVTMYVDPDVYMTIASTSFVKELAGVLETTTQRDGGTWSYTSLFIRGQYTFLEFMKASNSSTRSIGRAPTGVVSLAMQVDDRLKLPVVRDSLAGHTHTSPKIEVNKLFIDGRDISWYDSVSATDFGDMSLAARTWVSAFYPDWLRQRYPGLKPEEYGTTRDKRPDRPYYPDRLLHDITRLTLTVSSREEDQLLKDFESYGYKLQTEKEKRIASGPQIEFVLIPSGASPRKFAIELELNKPKSGEQLYEFGDGSELEFSGRTAVWYFPAGWRP